MGLSEALAQEAARFQERSGIKCRVELLTRELELGGEVATAVFRVFQEALTNVARHAQASSVHASLKVLDKQLTLEIQDDGRGIPIPALVDPRSLGLLGMRERAIALGGEVSVAPVQPHGTRVFLRLPLPAELMMQP
jgi:signal transduction histidine kinase